jgi:hypothetical protein
MGVSMTGFLEWALKYKDDLSFRFQDYKDSYLIVNEHTTVDQIIKARKENLPLRLVSGSINQECMEFLIKERIENERRRNKIT